MATTGLTNGSRQPEARISSETFLGSAGLLSCNEGAGLAIPATVAVEAFAWAVPALTRATGFTATAFAVAGFGIVCAIAGFGPDLLAFTETELDCAAALAGTAAGFTSPRA